MAFQVPHLVETTPFSQLSSKELEGLYKSRKLREFHKDEWLVHYGELWPYLFIVETGKIVAQKESAEGRSLTVTHLGPGDMFWGLAFFCESVPMWVGLRTAEDSLLSMWRREDMLPLLEGNGRFTWDLTSRLVKRMERASNMVEELAFQPVTGRLAALLLDQSEGKENEIVERELTLDEMAALIGSTREMVCRQLYQLADKGILEINRTEFRIRDAKSLTEIAGRPKG